MDELCITYHIQSTKHPLLDKHTQTLILSEPQINSQFCTELLEKKYVIWIVWELFQI